MRRLLYGLVALLFAGVTSYAVNVTSTSGGFSRINVVTFCATGCTLTGGSYTPTPGTIYADVTCIGGGGAGGGVIGLAGTARAGGGGGSGSYSRSIVWIAGTALTITIGAGGTGVAGDDGNPGGQTVVAGGLCNANPGSGGLNSGTSSGAAGAGGGASATCNLFCAPGRTGTGGWNVPTLQTNPWGGSGGGVFFSSKGRQTAGNNQFGGVWPGGGGSGVVGNAAGNFVGGNGAAGWVMIVEYIR